MSLLYKSLFLLFQNLAEEELETVQTGLRFHHQRMLLSPCATVQELLDQPAFRPEHRKRMIVVWLPPLHQSQMLVMMASFVLYV